MKKFMIFAVLITAFACKTKQNAQTEPAAPVMQSANQQNVQEEKIETPAKDDKIYTVLISFFSIGSGIDYDRKKEMDAYFYQLEDNKVAFTFEKVGWGREGEVDYCVDLSKLKKAEQEKTIAKIQEIAKKSSWIDVQLNKECRFKNIQR